MCTGNGRRDKTLLNNGNLGFGRIISSAVNERRYRMYLRFESPSASLTLRLASFRALDCTSIAKRIPIKTRISHSPIYIAQAEDCVAQTAIFSTLHAESVR